MKILERFSPRLISTENEQLLSIGEIQSRLECVIPSPMVEILNSYDGSIVFEETPSFPAKHSLFAGKSGQIGLELLYGRGDGFYGIAAANERYRDWLPLRSLPIGEVAGGNVVGVHLATEEVFLWLHDDPRPRGSVDDLFPSLRKFLQSLSVCKDEDLGDLGVDWDKTVWKL